MPQTFIDQMATSCCNMLNIQATEKAERRKYVHTYALENYLIIGFLQKITTATRIDERGMKREKS